VNLTCSARHFVTLGDARAGTHTKVTKHKHLSRSGQLPGETAGNFPAMLGLSSVNSVELVHSPKLLGSSSASEETKLKEKDFRI
jgi:hypothetical protein